MVLLILWVLALLGDNPMQSEFACHAGLKARRFCRICMVKGHENDESSISADREPRTQAQKHKESLSAMIHRVKQFLQVCTLGYFVDKLL